MKIIIAILVLSVSSVSYCMPKFSGQAGFQLKYTEEYATWAADNVRSGCFLNPEPYSKNNLQVVTLTEEPEKEVYFVSQHAICGNDVVSFLGIVTFVMQSPNSWTTEVVLKSITP